MLPTSETSWWSGQSIAGTCSTEALIARPVPIFAISLWTCVLWLGNLNSWPLASGLLQALLLVEGEGDVQAVPSLVGRLITQLPDDLQGQLFLDNAPMKTKTETAVKIAQRFAASDFTGIAFIWSWIEVRPRLSSRLRLLLCSCKAACHWSCARKSASPSCRLDFHSWRNQCRRLCCRWLSYQHRQNTCLHPRSRAGRHEL